jgi:hypothetical protein
VLRATAFGGLECPPLQQVERCNIMPCPKDCIVSPFSPWTTCSVSCGQGRQSAFRSIIQQPALGGLECPVLEIYRDCKLMVREPQCANTPHVC